MMQTLHRSLCFWENAGRCALADKLLHGMSSHFAFKASQVGIIGGIKFGSAFPTHDNVTDALPARRVLLACTTAWGGDHADIAWHVPVPPLMILRAGFAEQKHGSFICCVGHDSRCSRETAQSCQQAHGEGRASWAPGLLHSREPRSSRNRAKRARAKITQHIASSSSVQVA